MQNDEAERIKNWFLEGRRELPWRCHPTPYRVWVSEVMLQQTRASVVIPYFELWMKLFPTLEDLAVASEEAVIKAWEGLGYYNRARNLLKGAKYFVEHHEGKIPSCKESLLQAPGLGPYTVGAILSFAFKQKAAAVDGNVLRVISRTFGIKDNISSASTQKKIYELTEQFLPQEGPHIVMEGLIELGACICTKVARCHICPVSHSCIAHMKKLTHLLPVKNPPKKVMHSARYVPVIIGKGKVLVRKIPPHEVLAGLYEFLSVEIRGDTPPLEEELREIFSAPLGFIGDVKMQVYSFTNHRVELFPSIWETCAHIELDGYLWVEKREVHLLPFSSGHRRILLALKKENIL